MVRVFNDKIWACVDTRSSTDNIFHRNGKAVKKNPGILSQIEKEVEGRDDNFIDHVVRLEDAVAHSSTSDTSRILTNEKYASKL